MTRSAFQNLLAAAAVTAGLAVASAAAAATTVTENATLDLSQATVSPTTIVSSGPGFSGTTPFNLAVGDTLDFTIDFLGNQSITATPLTFLKAQFFSSDPSQTINLSNGAITLLDSTGAALAIPPVFLQPQTASASNIIGQDFVINLPSETFFGVHYTATVAGFSPLAGTAQETSRNFTTPAFQANTNTGGTISIQGLATTTGAVPEPATWAMLLVGFGGLGAMLRRRRATQALAA